MQNPRFLILLTAFAAFGLGGCGDGDAPVQGDESTPSVEDDSSGAPAEENAPPAGSTGEPGLSVVETPEYGMYIADSNGRALYLLTADAGGASTCVDACAKAWPPLLASNETPSAIDPAVQESLVGTLDREDGSKQVTYNGHPLYYYAKDAGPGEARGQDVTDEWGEWYLVTPQGEALQGNRDGADL